MKFRSLRIVTVLALSAGLLVTSPGCGDDDDDETTTMGDGDGDMTGDGDGDEVATLRVFHMSPDAPAVDLALTGGDVVEGFDGLEYLDAERDDAFPVGTYDLEVRLSDGGTVVLDLDSITLEEGDSIDVAVMGLASPDADASDALRAVLLNNNFGETDGNARVRVVHAVPDADTVDIDLGSPFITLPGEEVEYNDVEPYTASDEAGLEVTAGEFFVVKIRTAADDDDTNAPSPVDLDIITTFPTTAAGIPADSKLTAFITGFVGDHPRLETGLQIAIFADDSEAGLIVAQNPWVYAFHASPDAGTVQLAVDLGQAALGIGPFSYLQLGPVNPMTGAGSGAPLQLLPAQFGIQIYGPEATPGTDDPLATLPTPTFLPGTRNLVAVAGELDPAMDSNGLRIATFNEQVAINDDATAQLTAIHLAPDVGTVDVGTVENDTFTAVFEDLEFPALPDPADPSVPPGIKATGPGVPLPAATYTIGIAAADETTTVAEFDVPVEAEKRYIGAAVGLATPELNEEPLQLAVIDVTGFIWSFVAAISPNVDL